MADGTKIEWADASWNPIRAKRVGAISGKLHIGWHCEHVSEGCRHCYAEGINKRLGTGLDYKPGNLSEIATFLDEKTLLQPLRWKRGRRIFVGSMTDVFGRWVTDEMLDKLFAVAALCPQHQFLFLTKRSERMKQYCSALAAKQRNIIMAASDLRNAHGLMAAGTGEIITRLTGGAGLPNVWCGVSVEDRAATSRIEELRATPAAVRFISFEPLLEDLGEVDLRGVHLAIVGGESGPKARPMHPDWARSLRDQCKAAGAAFFMKQMTKKDAIPYDLMVRQFPNVA